MLSTRNVALGLEQPDMDVHCLKCICSSYNGLIFSQQRNQGRSEIIRARLRVLQFFIHCTHKTICLVSDLIKQRIINF